MLRCRSGSPVASRPSSWRSASRAEVPLPQGERSTSPSAKTVTFRWVSGILALLLPEDHPVDVAQLGLARVDDLLIRLQVGLDRPAELDQPREVCGLDALRAGGVERASERDVDPVARRLEVASVHERRHVPKAHRHDATLLDPGNRWQPSRRHVDDDLRPLDQPALDRPGDECDRPVPTGRRVAGVVEEDDAEVCPFVLRLGDEAAVHVRVAARLVDEQAADVVDVLGGVAPLVEDPRAGERLDAAGDDPEGLARGVVVDRPDQRPLKFGGRFSRNAVTPSRKSSVFVAAAWSRASSSSCSSSVARVARSRRCLVIPIATVGPAA